MNSVLRLFFVSIAVCGVSAAASAQRQAVDLSGPGWKLWLDSSASWRDDALFAPPVELGRLPVNPPTGGWGALSGAKSLDVAVPGTVVEYVGKGRGPKEEVTGVSWWFRQFKVPTNKTPRRILLRFESARLRAEVYVNRKLVAYDLVGSTPFEADLTGVVKPGEEAELAVRITDPGGNFDWVDYAAISWGHYSIPASHGFGGITGTVTLISCDPVYVDDVYVQNAPAAHEARVKLNVRNSLPTAARRDVRVVVRDPKAPGRQLATKLLKAFELKPGDNAVEIAINAPQVELWDLEKPRLYLAEASLIADGVVSDSAQRAFGFRWFALDGIGKDAMLRLNGRRIVLRTAISWGYWPVNGIFPTPELAEKQVRSAKAFGLNMLNFHRAIGSPIVLDRADELGLLYYEEPGGYISARSDPFAQSLAREKLLRMVKRDRSHPSLVIYGMLNEEWADSGADHDDALWATHRADLSAAHALDPSRLIVYASAWAKKPGEDERAKLHMRPFDERQYLQGWFDYHRARGPETWREDFYRSPSDHYGRTENAGEIIYWGEEGAMSSPPRLGRIKQAMQTAPQLGWDGAVYLDWFKSFDDFIQRKKLSPAFGDVEGLVEAMAKVSIGHQGRKIEDTRICDLNDGYAINGWESQIVDNHSGIVDEFRNPKADPAVMAYYNQPLFIAVKPRAQVYQVPDSALVDFYVINEKDLRGPHTLHIAARDPSGKVVFSQQLATVLRGGDVYSQLAGEGLAVPVASGAGFYEIEAKLFDPSGRERASGHDRVFAVDWKSSRIRGAGAVYESKDRVRRFLKEGKGLDVPAFDDKQGPLDWLVVARPVAEQPEIISTESFVDMNGRRAGLKATFFAGRELTEKLVERTDATIDLSSITNAPPAAVLSVAKGFSVRWEGFLKPTVAGMYLFAASVDGGVRVWVDDRLIINRWRDGNERVEGAIELAANTPVPLKVEVFQNGGSALAQLQWVAPDRVHVDPARIIERVKKDGTTLLVIDSADSWARPIADAAALKLSGRFDVGHYWLGGQYFVREHSLFKDLPVNQALDWPYQSLVREGPSRYALELDGEELVAGAYRSAPFHLGTAVGVVALGKGRVVLSTLDIASNLDSGEHAAEVARKLLCNYLEFAAKK